MQHLSASCTSDTFKHQSLPIRVLAFFCLCKPAQSIFIRSEIYSPVGGWIQYETEKWRCILFYRQTPLVVWLRGWSTTVQTKIYQQPLVFCHEFCSDIHVPHRMSDYDDPLAKCSTVMMTFFLFCEMSVGWPVTKLGCRHLCHSQDELW